MVQLAGKDGAGVGGVATVWMARNEIQWCHLPGSVNYSSTL